MTISALLRTHGPRRRPVAHEVENPVRENAGDDPVNHRHREHQ